MMHILTRTPLSNKAHPHADLSPAIAWIYKWLHRMTLGAGPRVNRYTSLAAVVQNGRVFYDAPVL